MLDAVRAALEPVAAVRVAYLFGSVATGKQHAASDLDLAISFTSSLDGRARHLSTLAIIAALADKLGALGERADVVDLDGASSAVAFAAINGCLVICRDVRERVLLETRIARRYDDEAPTRELYRRAARARWSAQ